MQELQETILPLLTGRRPPFVVVANKVDKLSHSPSVESMNSQITQGEHWSLRARRSFARLTCAACGQVVIWHPCLGPTQRSSRSPRSRRTRMA